MRKSKTLYLSNNNSEGGSVARAKAARVSMIKFTLMIINCIINSELKINVK